MNVSKGAERARNAAGRRRKEIERALGQACQDWRGGKPGDLILGELEQAFFAGDGGITCDHNTGNEQ